MSDNQAGLAQPLGANEVANPGIDHSNSPPTGPLQTFTLFRRLPAELRNKIWTLAAHLPRNIDLWESEKLGTSPPLVTTTPPPAILHTNQEARGIGLQYYTPKFGTSEARYDHTCAPTRIYMNYASDRLVPMGDYGSRGTESLSNGLEWSPIAVALNIACHYITTKPLLSYSAKVTDCNKNERDTWPTEIFIYFSPEAGHASMHSFRTINFTEVKHEAKTPHEVLPMLDDPLLLVQGLALVDHEVEIQLDCDDCGGCEVCYWKNRGPYYLLAKGNYERDDSLLGWAIRTNTREYCRRVGQEMPAQRFSDLVCPNTKFTSLILNDRAMGTLHAEDFNILAKSEEFWKETKWRIKT